MTRSIDSFYWFSSLFKQIFFKCYKGVVMFIFWKVTNGNNHFQKQTCNSYNSTNILNIQQVYHNFCSRKEYNVPEDIREEWALLSLDSHMNLFFIKIRDTIVMKFHGYHSLLLWKFQKINSILLNICFATKTQ